MFSQSAFKDEKDLKRLFKVSFPFFSPPVSFATHPPIFKAPSSSSMSLYLFDLPALPGDCAQCFPCLPPLLFLPAWSVGPITSFLPFLYFHVRVSAPPVCKHPDTSPIGLSPCKISVRPQVSGTGHTSNNGIRNVFCVFACLTLFLLCNVFCLVLNNAPTQSWLFFLWWNMLSKPKLKDLHSCWSG